MKNLTVLIMVFFLTGAGLLSGEETLILTEETAVSLAVGRNLSLQSARLDLEGKSEALKNSWNVLLPAVSAGVGASRSEEVFTDPRPANGPDTGEDNTWGVSASLSAELPLNYAALLAVDQAKLSKAHQSLVHDLEQDALILQVKKQFYYLLAYKEDLDLRKKNLDLAEKRYEQTRTNYENGLASELNVLEARTSFQSMRPSYTNAKISYETQLMAFKKLLVLDLDREIDVEGSLDIDPPDLEGDALIDSLMMNRLDIQRAMKQRELQENVLAVTQAGNLTPTFGVNAEWASSAADGSDPEWYDSATLSLFMTLPLNGFIPGASENLDIREAKREVEKADLSLEDLILSAEEEIRSILMTLEGAQENMEISALSVELALKTYEMTESAYNLGTREILEVEDAQNKLLSSRQDLIQSRYNYLSGLLDLQFALNADMSRILDVSRNDNSGGQND